MHFSELPQSELKFLKRSSYKSAKFAIPFDRDKEILNGIVSRPHGRPANYYYQNRIPKKRIVLHATAGHLDSDIRTLTQDSYHVSVPFVISRSGVIYQLFNPEFWSYHLGQNAIGGNKKESASTIGIELCNYLIINRKGKQLMTPYSKPDKLDVYCNLKDKSQYQYLENNYRRINFFPVYTSAQYKSLAKLLRYLTYRFDIPRQFLPSPLRYNTTDKVLNFKGIVSHVNYRLDKYDIGPAFDWKRVEIGVQRNINFYERFGHKKALKEALKEGQLNSETAIDERFEIEAPSFDIDNNIYGPDGPDI